MRMMSNKTVGNSLAAGSMASTARVNRMILAAGKLSEPARTLFDRLFIRGEKGEAVRKALDMNEAEFDQHHQAMLHTLMIATSR